MSLSFSRSTNAGLLEPEQIRTIKIPIEATVDVQSVRHEFRVEVSEEYYRDVTPFTFSFESRVLAPPEFRIILKEYDDSREIFKRNAPDGSIDAGELIRVTANVQNVGAGEAELVKANVHIEGEGDEVHYRRDLSESGNTDSRFEFGAMPTGSARDVLFYFFTNPMFNKPKVNVTVEVAEARGRYNTSKTFSFDIGQSVSTERVLAVSAVRDRGKEIQLVESELIDVDRVPTGSKTKLPDALAVIWGIETYKYTFDAAYKERDATVFFKYCRDVLGIPEERILLRTNEDATKGEFDYVFEPKGSLREGWLKKRLKNEEQTQRTDVFVYLGGHGFPDMATGKPYFIPYDIRPEQATNGVSLDELYETLAGFGARNVFVFVESCFSGASGYRRTGEEMLLAANINPVLPMLESPLIGKNMVVLTLDYQVFFCRLWQGFCCPLKA